MTDDQAGNAISEAELAEMERRTQVATPGPWRSFIEGRDHFSGSHFIMVGTGKNRGEDIEGPPPNDLDFIAAARQDVPRLIAEVRRLRALLGEKK